LNRAFSNKEALLCNIGSASNPPQNIAILEQSPSLNHVPLQISGDFQVACTEGIIKRDR
jgi:hypothetical protein